MIERNSGTLIEALNDCIDRMSAGASLESCLRTYPRYARQLRPMLEAGLLVARAQADAMEVAAAQRRVRAAIVQTLDMPVRRRTGLMRYGNLAAAAVLVVLIALVGAGVIEVARRILTVVPTFAVTTEPLATPSDIPGATPTPSVTPSPTPTETPTATPSLTATRTVSATPTNSAVPTRTATRTAPTAGPTLVMPTAAPLIRATDDSGDSDGEDGDDGEDDSGSSENSGSGGSDDEGGDDNSGRGGGDDGSDD